MSSLNQNKLIVSVGVFECLIPCIAKSESSKFIWGPGTFDLFRARKSFSCAIDVKTWKGSKKYAEKAKPDWRDKAWILWLCLPALQLRQSMTQQAAFFRGTLRKWVLNCLPKHYNNTYNDLDKWFPTHFISNTRNKQYQNVLKICRLDSTHWQQIIILLNLFVHTAFDVNNQRYGKCLLIVW